MDVVTAVILQSDSEAQIVGSVLRSARIDATVVAASRRAPASILVPEDQLADARAILAQFEPAPPTAPTAKDSFANLAPVLAIVAAVVVGGMALVIWSLLKR